MGRNSGSNRNINKIKANPVSVKDIFNDIQLLNPSVSRVSSLGSYISHSSRLVSEAVAERVEGYLPKNSFAAKIMSSTPNRYSEKQLWAIAYELQKNKKYTKKLGEDIARRKAEIKAKKESSKRKLQANKAASQGVLNLIKSKGFKLGDYYNWLKTDKRYKREFFSKKYSAESANEFMKR